MRNKVKYYSKKFNQLFLALPIWIALGIMKPLKNTDKNTGWTSKEKTSSYEKMY